MADHEYSIIGSLKKLLVDMRDGAHADRVIAAPPFDLMTDGGSGPNRRLRVDVGQTGFFAGREFRTFKELNVANGSTYVVKALVPINIILFGLEIVLDQGFARVSTHVGGTEGGSFSETLPVIPRNNMSERPLPLYTPQVMLAAGGTHSGGTEIDLIRIKVENATGAQASVGSAQQDERGIAAATYYIRVANVGSGSLTGTFKARWEERP
ncbi:hypothetical protein [Lysobacter antibioticus]|uniref:hypothetical protein n=1 Tax=Lysobacter antibioticus TaxID=84531 RepID=UPI0007E8BAAF|nr:hypothetical protein [Lysobacter antibioticus]